MTETAMSRWALTRMRMSLWTMVAVALLVSTGSPAAAQDGSGSRGPVVSTDAATYAAILGVTEPEAARRFRLLDLVGALETELRNAAPDSFAGLWLVHQPEFAVEIRFTDTQVGEALVETLRKELKADLTYRVERAGASLAALEELQRQAIHDALAAGVPVDADIDVQANRVEVMATDLAHLETALAALRPGREDLLTLIAVDRLAEPEQLQPLRGGRPLSTCTTGFTVRHTASGRPGVLTAGHCGNGQTYWDTFQTLPFGGEAFGGSADVQWHNRACNMTVPNDFDSGIGIRQVTGTRHRDQQVINSMVCRNGMTTPYRCGFIVSKSFRPGGPSYPGSWNSTFIRVRPYAETPSPFSGGGDSGGPWFLETLAYGIHSGRIGDGGLDDRFYTAINYISGLGVSVLTANGGTGSLWANLSCFGGYAGSFEVSCWATPNGGVPPYSYLWNYWGDAPTWSSSGSSAWATYGSWPGCPVDALNLFSVQVTDSCGQSGGGGAEVICEGQTCPPFEFCNPQF